MVGGHMKFRWALLVVTGLLGWCMWLTNLSGLASAHPAGHQAAVGRYATATGGTISLTIPAACLSSTATHRTYPLNAPAGDNYWRSGEHGHGKLTCIVFMTRTYSKVLVVDQAAGGYTIPVPGGVDVTYVDCVPPLRFPAPPFTGINDCGESWGTGEGNWLFPPGYAGAGTAMIPSATP